MRAAEITALEAALGHRFQHRELLEQALTHASHAHEAESRAPASGARDNEQLEFLGDAVLGFLATRELYRRFPDFHEGELSKMRAHMVSAQHLVHVAGELELGRYLRLGRGEEKSGGRHKAALLADAVEAVLAALYLDAGLGKAEEFVVQRVIGPALERLERETGVGLAPTDHKSALQEFLQAQGRPQPRYVLVEEAGPDHRKTFTVEVRIQSPGRSAAAAFQAQGPNKKIAEQRAARRALEHLAAAEEATARPASRRRVGTGSR
ncbi:MAG TPA: ribonuclease III [Terriglobales bacterium]|nr:ribonuclease III [Terriglobales bacterium]